jgi:hypothetical protein
MGLAAYKLLKYKTYRDCLHSMNAPTLVLEDPRGGKPLALIITYDTSHFDLSFSELSV